MDGGLVTSCFDQETTSIVHIEGIFMFDAFKRHLTLDVRSVIHEVNTDHVGISGGMTS
jgi:hypothetical protein